MSRRGKQSLKQIGQQEGSENHRRRKCRKKELGGRVLICPISNSHKIRMNKNFGMRFTTSSSVAQDMYVHVKKIYKIWKWHEWKNFVSKGAKIGHSASHNSNTL